ncbi:MULTISPECIES: DUF4245 domain-containing protein [unclassified Gordonia (in: high G+C Gram-positive bacteria)]|uniref:DUF4245 domain-containing protein n=1 Tax=unclassified Gordonia (in: high G+C Gram-positive bacteria) TaxID=2657482 RepID=UPI001F109D26|nr:DUF4245 domain-containing protein [Gordonia sp. ABSL49_1]MCH5642121.1 DUF4245 domain-containing protein [Gordonia sp. ABSL49_1]
MAQKPRYLTSGKDMIWSLIPLLAICAFVAIVSGNCSVGLTGRADDDRTQAFDVEHALKADAADMPFPIRLPVMPSSWKPNSGSAPSVDGHRVSTAGWVSANGAYVQLTQSDASEESLIGYLRGDEGYDAVTAGGTREVAGRTWVTYSTGEKKKFWITDLGDVRIAVLSRGSDADMEQLATATLTQQPLPRRG